MRIHRNASLGLARRRELVLAVAGGCSIREAAVAFRVSPATAHRWWQRWRQATDAERQSLSCLFDRSSRPRRSPRRLPLVSEQLICDCRRRTGWGPRLVGGETGFPHSTVWKVLRRHGISRAPAKERLPAHRYEWPCPGDLLHMDVSTYARFEEPGRHQLTGITVRPHANKKARVGYDYVHAAVDDHSRLAYAEIHSDDKAATVIGFLERALAFYRDHGISVRRLLTDNAMTYTKSRGLRELLEREQIKHKRTRPYRPQTNGKVERFNRTMLEEWAYAKPYRSEAERAAEFDTWLHHYNHHRGHTALKGKSPADLVPNLCGQNI